MTAYDQITQRILELLDKGTVPWRQPWSNGIPANCFSKKEYRGINVLMLAWSPFKSRFWATELQIDDAAIARALAGFQGIDRRMQFIADVQTPAGRISIVDDYGHHPTELAATMDGLRQAYPGRRLVLAFQPHRYTRTRDCFEDFVRVLSTVDALVREVQAQSQLRAVQPQLTHQQPPQLVVLVDVAVRVAEEDRLVGAADRGGGALLLLADAGQVLRGDLGVLRSLVAAGGDDHVDVPAARAEQRERAAAGELGVVGVREHGERALRRLRLEFVEEDRKSTRLNSSHRT